ncbi:DUF418 domain-containing protein [Paenibacillus ehimensis]|uniref:DUF418 domain-containing protein n=1 Tax=Paenibacillus ehimensis TaxID=79264 RepID=UPI000FDCB89A|nr:DUF418 domain-containing protein [Paenibacillus ehimensis]MEC0211294.1 DUF418 domain-containing protein [Paenibacillus ehimensis]
MNPLQDRQGQTVPLPAATQQADRIQELDLIRGIALLGILIVNMQVFSYPVIYVSELKLNWWEGMWDRMAEAFIAFVAQDKSRPMFSFLFGLGFMIFVQRAEQKGGRPLALFARRLLVLLGIGLIHAYFIWFGDILVTYAVLGFFLIFFRGRAPRTLLRWACGLLLVPAVLLTAAGLLEGPGIFGDPQLKAAAPALIEQSLQAYGQGSWKDIFAQNSFDWQIALAGYLTLSPVLFAMFLLGAYAGKTGVFQHVAEHRKRVQKVWIGSLALGLPLLLPALMFEKSEPAYKFVEFIGLWLTGPVMSLFYICSILLLAQIPLWRRLLAPLQAVGRMAATNYLGQSVVCTWIFYSYGLGLYGQVGPAGGLAIAAAVFGAQVLFSNLWLKRYRFGPVEWIWRTLTYGRMSPIRKGGF